MHTHKWGGGGGRWVISHPPPPTHTHTHTHISHQISETKNVRTTTNSTII